MGVRRADESRLKMRLSWKLLQRSRTRGSAERLGAASLHKGPREASTEPHSWECGEDRGKGQENINTHEASTEPHSWECGESPYPTRCS